MAVDHIFRIFQECLQKQLAHLISDLISEDCGVLRSWNNPNIPRVASADQSHFSGIVDEIGSLKHHQFQLTFCDSVDLVGQDRKSVLFPLNFPEYQRFDSMHAMVEIGERL